MENITTDLWQQTKKVLHNFPNMADYERINFRKNWYQDIEEYLENNPELGFDPEDVKYFIKYCVKKEMARTVSEEEKIQKIIEELRKED